MGFLFVRALDDSRLPAFHQDFQSWLPWEGWWMLQQAECRLCLSFRAACHPPHPRTTIGTKSASAACSLLRPRSSLHLLKCQVRLACLTSQWDPAVPSRALLSYAIVSDLSNLVEKPWIDTLSEQPLDQICACTDFHISLRLDFLGLTLELSVVESGIRHQNPLYSPV